jgi:hypothetical protein
MLVFVDQFGLISEHFAREGFGHLRPALRFLKEPATWGVFVEAA